MIGAKTKQKLLNEIYKFGNVFLSCSRIGISRAQYYRWKDEDEKFKKLKSGEVNRHVYYFCNKSKDRNCKCGYINEDDLLKQFEQLIDNINLDEVGIKEKIRAEIERFKKFQRMISGNNDDVKVNNVDIRNYAKYILREGSILEKRELLSCLKSKIFLKNQKIFLE